MAFFIFPKIELLIFYLPICLFYFAFCLKYILYGINYISINYVRQSCNCYQATFNSSIRSSHKIFHLFIYSSSSRRSRSVKILRVVRGLTFLAELCALGVPREKRDTHADQMCRRGAVRERCAYSPWQFHVNKCRGWGVAPSRASQPAPAGFAGAYSRSRRAANRGVARRHRRPIGARRGDDAG